MNHLQEALEAEERTLALQLYHLRRTLEAEERTLALQLYHLRRTLEHLRTCRRELKSGKPVIREGVA